MSRVIEDWDQGNLRCSTPGCTWAFTIVGQTDIEYERAVVSYGQHNCEPDPTHVMVYACSCGEEVRLPMVLQPGDQSTGATFTVPPNSTPPEHRGHGLAGAQRIEPIGWLEDRVAAALEASGVAAFSTREEVLRLILELGLQGLKVVPQ